jgi:hypothetical protein
MTGDLIRPVDRLTLVELQRICICVRVCRLQIDRNLMELQEKLRVHDHENASDREALLHMANDMYLTGSALRKLDRMVREYKP